MSKCLTYIAALTLATITLNFFNYASADTNNGKVPHIDGNGQFPSRNSAIVRYTFELHVPQNSRAVTQLFISIPKTITISNNIKNIAVTNKDEHKINTNININAKFIQLDFLKPIAPNTKFTVDLNNVKKGLFPRIQPVFQVWAKEVGINSAIPIGTVLF